MFLILGISKPYIPDPSSSLRCTKDPTWPKRLPGVSNCILISDGRYDWFKKWTGTKVGERGEDYEDFKNQLTKHLLDILYETVPQVKGKVEFYHLGTPLTEISYLGSWHAVSSCNLYAHIITFSCPPVLILLCRPPMVPNVILKYLPRR